MKHPYLTNESKYLLLSILLVVVVGLSLTFNAQAKEAFIYLSVSTGFIYYFLRELFSIGFFDEDDEFERG